jgi:hypothetical protein
VTTPPDVDQSIGDNRGRTIGIDDRSTGARQTVNVQDNHPYDSLYAVGRRMDRLETTLEARLLYVERELAELKNAAQAAFQAREAARSPLNWNIILVALFLVAALLAVFYFSLRVGP